MLLQLGQQSNQVLKLDSPFRKNLPKTKQMWWNGFPSTVRGQMWILAIANDLNITEELFEIFGGHAKSAREKKGATLGR